MRPRREMSSGVSASSYLRPLGQRVELQAVQAAKITKAQRISVVLGEQHAARAGRTGFDADARFGRRSLTIVGQAADRGFGGLFDGLFGGCRAIPVRVDELGAFALEDGDEVIPSVDGQGVGFAELERTVVQEPLELVEDLADCEAQVLHR